MSGDERLESLYPFLHQRGKDPERESAVLLESVRQKAAHSVAVEFQHPVTAGRPSLPAFNLVNTQTLLADLRGKPAQEPGQ